MLGIFYPTSLETFIPDLVYSITTAISLDLTFAKLVFPGFREKATTIYSLAKLFSEKLL